MANYDFSRLNVLVVEDNTYMRSLLSMALRALGVGVLKLATHGGEAIDVLRLMQHDPSRVGVATIDVVFSNWEMSPVNGLILLRWIRRHKESPDRFLPFIMVTAHADKGKVAEARELGVTEMLAKPFSVEMVAQRLLQVVEKPRQFVHTKDYFGPDRRRRADTFDGRDRRRLTDTSEGVEIVYD
jgi:CheY-like chemotaxis protein